MFTITCVDCGAPAESKVRHAKRCQTCSAKRRQQGSAGRASRKNRPSQLSVNRRPKRMKEGHARVEGAVWWGVDGEGINRVVDGKMVHEYVYMAAVSSDGRVCQLSHSDCRTLTTSEILWWLYKLPEGRKTFYSSGYDWTKILADVDPEVLADLHDAKADPFEPTWWEGFGITYLKGAVTIVRAGSKRQAFFADMWRCLGVGSFVNAINAWQIGTPEQRHQVEEMKAQRAHFGDLTEDIKRYCRLECSLLAQLAKKAAVTASELDLRPPQWYSSGSLSKAMMRLENVKEHRGEDRYAGGPPDVLSRAYFGGRFELTQTGVYPALHQYDLSAAYPAAMLDLPCLACGHWENRFIPGAVNVEFVSWQRSEPWDVSSGPTGHPHDHPWGPLPFRLYNGSIYYPEAGSGWYWEPEVTAARALPGFKIRRTKAWSFVPECDHHPFMFMAERHEQRLALGKEAKGLMLKGTSNGAYGTTADTVSQNSPFASVIWSGLITAKTRARLMEVIARHPNEIVMAATDGLFSRSVIMPTTSNKVLGAWDYKGVSEECILIQPGVYWAERGIEKEKTRGHAVQDIIRLKDELRSAWLTRGWEAIVTYERTRFIPAKLALMRCDWSCLGQWQTQTTDIRFKPSRRIVSPPADGIGRSWPQLAAVRLLRQHEGNPPSAPYSKLVTDEAYKGDLMAKELENGQP